MKTNPNDPIGLIAIDGVNYPHQLTKREYFAAMAIQGLLASDGDTPIHRLTALSVEIADALIASLNANQTEE